MKSYIGKLVENCGIPIGQIIDQDKEKLLINLGTITPEGDLALKDTAVFVNIEALEHAYWIKLKSLDSKTHIFKGNGSKNLLLNDFMNVN